MRDVAHTRLSILDLAPVSVGQSVSEALRNTLALAEYADRWGYHRYWLAEHHNMDGVAASATAVLIGQVAALTRRIRVGAGGVMLPNHTPQTVAEQFGTLEILYPGRIDLGLGRSPGGDYATMEALRVDMIKASREFPERVRDLLQCLTRRSGPAFSAPPGEGANVPVWLLGSSLVSARLAAELGLPYAFAAQFAPARLQEALALYRERFQPSDYQPRPRVIVAAPVVAADTDEQARHLARSMYRRTLDWARGESGQLKPPSTELDWSDTERAVVEEHYVEAIIGGPDTVRTGLQDLLIRTEANELLIHTDTYDFKDRLRSYEIVSQIKS
ncbi:luciferase family oxidoreductase group 1 [Pseudomonas duriflava]|uniref:Luciferase-like monooxygenase n=1 Tax=Pseudomonas duriflava TaxID=459528 RepID=A0A562QL92_9PSED|nr:LLM class flavin-dependent oxidoreductase [Pseudomonas duriflava]TWI57484.1 luciferase family oxidoreductase group 1 [Pseudomonas duriflava]